MPRIQYILVHEITFCFLFLIIFNQILVLVLWQDRLVEESWSEVRVWSDGVCHGCLYAEWIGLDLCDDGVYGACKDCAHHCLSPRPWVRFATAFAWTCTWPWSWGMASIFASTLQIRDRIRKVDANRNCDQTFLFCQELKKKLKNLKKWDFFYNFQNTAFTL